MCPHHQNVPRPTRIHNYRITSMRVLICEFNCERNNITQTEICNYLVVGSTIRINNCIYRVLITSLYKLRITAVNTQNTHQPLAFISNDVCNAYCLKYLRDTGNVWTIPFSEKENSIESDKSFLRRSSGTVKGLRTQETIWNHSIKDALGYFYSCWITTHYI